METTSPAFPLVEPVTISEVLELASWDRPRSDEELHSLLKRRHQQVGTFDLEDVLEDSSF